MERVTKDMPTLLLVNPHSRRGKQTFERLSDELGDVLNLRGSALTTSADDMSQRIREGLDGGIRRFIIGGGDGTLSHAADVLAGSNGVLGVLPLGTGNTFSHGLGLPATLPHLLKLLAEGPVARYDVGLAEKDHSHKIFLNSLTVGFSERLVELLSREVKDRLGYLAWIVAFRHALAGTPTMQVALSWPDGHDEYQTRQLMIVNGRTIAAGISATPMSSGQDGLLEVFRLGDPSLVSIVRLGTKLLTGRLLTDREAHYAAVKEVSVRTNPALPVNIDGEIWKNTPLACRVIPGSLLVITPSSQGQSPDRWPLVTRTLGGPRTLMPRFRTYSTESSRNLK
ncbi:diacylglycerol/lipid kinase family protein [Sulfobacillus harzensis]|uniref:Diacylglycerol kinase n=1 Tax=Sulfobacillus harzensis TaxID=2729629 RepID=A0A7Y0L1S4_9FIRM|nr:diacylglycerol kinase family protein [Sulfobacillus harzensis]NMP21698.1 diacylglycerol kinase [Sulfobacillus harzensis]